MNPLRKNAAFGLFAVLAVTFGVTASTPVSGKSIGIGKLRSKLITHGPNKNTTGRYIIKFKVPQGSSSNANDEENKQATFIRNRVFSKIQSFGSSRSKFAGVKYSECAGKGLENRECAQIRLPWYTGAVVTVDGERSLDLLLQDEDVEFVEEDVYVSTKDCVEQEAQSYWGLDLIDAADGTNSRDYKYTHDSSGGDGVWVYVVDTGVSLSHVEFEGRAQHGTTTCNRPDLSCTTDTDYNGHGTHVAGIVGGRTTGVAKKVNIVAVKALDDNGEGTSETLIKGVEWAYTDIRTRGRRGRAVVNLSLGGDRSRSENEVINSAYTRDGILTVVAAGNEGVDACLTSPASAEHAITVGWLKLSNGQLLVDSASNYGSCVDIFAPGTRVRSAFARGTTDYETLSGSSMAAPHVAGAVALYLGANSGACAGVDQVTSWLLTSANSGISNADRGSPNRIVTVPCDVQCQAADAATTSPTPRPTSPPPSTRPPTLTPQSDPFDGFNCDSGKYLCWTDNAGNNYICYYYNFYGYWCYKLRK